MASTKRTVLLCAAMVTLSGCDLLGTVPLPGGAPVGDNPMEVMIEFDDVLDLAPQSAVKLNGVPIGRVSRVSLDSSGWRAVTTIQIPQQSRISSRVFATIQQTSLLGEKFVDLRTGNNIDQPLGAPPESAPEFLQNFDVVPVENTRSATDIEQVLGAMSLLLNGGGLANIQPIVSELRQLTEGRESELARTIKEADLLLVSLEAQTDTILATLEDLTALSTSLSARQQKIDDVLASLPEGIQAVENQRPQFMELMKELDKLGTTGTRVLMASREDLIADLRALSPVLRKIAEISPDGAEVLRILPTFPFPDNSIPAVVGNSLNLFLSVDLQLNDVLSNLGVGKPPEQLLMPRTNHPYVVDMASPNYFPISRQDPPAAVKVLPVGPALGVRQLSDPGQSTHPMQPLLAVPSHQGTAG